MGPGKFHQRSKSHDDQVPTKYARSVRAINVENESSSSESEPSESKYDADHRRSFATTASNPVRLSQDHRISHEEADRVELPGHVECSKACTHCGSIKHNDRGCSKRLACQKCGRKGHPLDKCFYACADCNNVHENSK